jgi:LytS/YehU family sensor histidine kinase
MASEMINADRITDIIKSSKQYLQIIYENDIKFVLKVRDVPTVEIKVEEEGSTLSINILEPDNLGHLVQQFRSIMG